MIPSSAFGPDRRQKPRVSVAALTFICFESDDNGGVVQNISEGGVCLRVILPIDAGDMFRLWFVAEKHRVDVEAHVEWVDESRRTAGLSFKILSPHPRDEIRKWIYAATSLPSSSSPPRTTGRIRRWLIESLNFGIRR